MTSALVDLMKLTACVIPFSMPGCLAPCHIFHANTFRFLIFVVGIFCFAFWVFLFVEIEKFVWLLILFV